MGLIFKDKLHDEFGSWPLAYIPYGGADFGECLVTVRQITPGDPDSWHRAWTATAASRSPSFEATTPSPACACDDEG